MKKQFLSLLLLLCSLGVQAQYLNFTQVVPETVLLPEQDFMKLNSDDVGDIVAGDLDNDGDIDYVSFDEVGGYKRLKIFINDGNNQFTGSFVNTSSDFSYRHDVKKLADIDNDGDLDVIQRYDGVNTDFLRVYFNDGAGSFTTTLHSQIIGDPTVNSDFFLADFNNDGYLDMITFVGTHDIKLLINDGQGNFSASTTFTITNDISVVSGTNVLDYNNDGFPDIYINDADSYVLLNDGAGQFTQQNIQGTNFQNNVVYLHDIDGDNDFDAIVERKDVFEVNTLELYTNDGNGNYSLSQSLSIKTHKYFILMFQDINNDNHVDILPLAIDTNSIPIMLNDGTGHFNFDDSNYLPYSQYFNNYYNPSYNYHFVDLDNDQDKDLIINGKKRHILINENGKFFTAGNVRIDKSKMSNDMINYSNDESYLTKMQLDLADVDGDGIKDLLVCGRASGNRPATRLYKGTTTGFDPMPFRYFKGLLKGKAFLKDMNNDTYPDVVVIGKNFRQAIVAKYYINDGSGNFTEHTYDIESSIGLHYGIEDVAIANFNGDSYPDIAVLMSSTNRAILRVYVTNGTDITTRTFYDNYFPTYSEILTFDANADQIDDIFTLGRLLINDGTGNMQQRLNLYNSHIGKPDALTIDIDNDGDLDLLVKSWVDLGYQYRTFLYLNDGNGNYSLSDDAAAYYDLIISKAAIVDIDNDNDNDIFGLLESQFNSNINRNFLYLNNNKHFYELLNDDFTTQNETSELSWDNYGFLSNYLWYDLNGDNSADLITFNLDDPTYLVIKYNNGVSNANDLHFEVSDYLIPRLDSYPVYHTNSIDNFLTNNVSGATIGYYRSLVDAENQTNPLTNTFVNNTGRPMPIVARMEQNSNISYYSFNLDINPPVYLFNPKVIDVGNDGSESTDIYGVISSSTYRFYHTYDDAVSNINPISPANRFYTFTQPQTTLWFTNISRNMEVSPMTFDLINTDDYTYNVQQTPFNLYIVPTQSTTINVDDQYSPEIDISFPFQFFYNSYNQLVFSDNGIVSFNTNKANGYCPWRIDNPIPDINSSEKNAIYGVYQDIKNNSGTGTMGYSVIGSAPFRKFITFYNEMPLFLCNSNTMTTQIVLYETYNFVDVQVGERTPCTSWNNGNGILGVIDLIGTNAYTPPNRNMGDWTATDEAWRFKPSFSFPDFQYVLCDANGDGIENFDLSVIQNHYSGSTVSIHLSKEDAEANINPITGNYTNISNAQTLYARVDNGSTTEIKNVLIAAIDCNADYDIDGVPTNTEDINANGNYGDDDTDNDGIPDFVDDDDDGDMILTQFELVNTRPSPRTVNSYSDTDGDGTPNYLDDDDDGDGTLTINEDYDGDGNPANDDINNNGIPDYLDDQVTANIIYLPDSAIHIYPIPAKDFLHIDFNIDITDAKMKLFTQDGKMIQQEMLKTSQNLIILPETKGIYYLKIITDKGEMNKPIIVR